MNNIVLKSTIELTDSQKLSTPVVIVNSPVATGVLKSHVEYLVNYRNKSLSWRKQSCKAISLLLDYTDAMGKKFDSATKMFKSFADAVFEGTFDDNGDDVTGLYWEPRSPGTANVYIRHVTGFSDWLYSQVDDEKLLLNPKRWATESERICNLAAFHHRKNQAFLSHTYYSDKAYKEAKHERTVKQHKAPPKVQQAKRLKSDVARHLIEEGFWRYKPNFEKPEQLNLRNVLITMLLAYGGLRISEPFQIYVSDLHEDPIDPNSILVKVCNPTLGDAPEYWRRKTGNAYDNRKSYLRKKYALETRKESTSANYHAGYKSESFYEFTVQWFPLSAGVVFKKLVTIYLSNERYRTVNKDKPHPFLFTNKSGAPASLAQYRKAHTNALIKLGYDPSRFAGNNPHGNRHNYASTLAELGVDPLARKKSLHHSSLESQKVYQSDVENKEIRNEFAKAEAAIQSNSQSDQNKMLCGFEDVDPRGYFSGLSPLFKSN
ncbi:gamma-mobile-trio recombinase GmtY [Pseudoalteromonas phenolica]|uniref:gamma-mobile-trio recombinase GmtY n=1 Tax=Pseudoalteromonas phenolica TaxID=161398 RepID=UPI00110AA74C|nr:gamma-mobile-trio recombinase GmtY [Pseudoalteromonas phenolica]TMO56358.1 hypothetical protein CWC21_06560 [Pseudoalteromonas phenolica]